MTLAVAVHRGDGEFGTFAIATLIALAVLFAGNACAADAGTAVAYQISVAHNGVQVDGLLSLPFVRRWQVTLPGAVSYPLIAQGMVFVTIGAYSTPASVSTLYALDQASGKTVWSQPLGQPGPFNYPMASPAYDNGRVFAVDSTGVMMSYDAGTGTLLWTTTLPNQSLFSSPPTAANGVVYTGGAGTGGTVYAVDQTTGSVLATQSVENGDHSSPALSSTSVFVSYACNQVYGFAQATLAPRWHYSGPCEGGGGRTPAYENGRVYTRDFFFGNLILDAATGNLLGSYGPPSMSFSPSIVAPAVSGNTMWLLSGGTLSAQDVSSPSTPSTLWSFTGDGQLVTAPIVLSTPGGVFVVEGSSSGMLYALNAATGAPVWSTNVGAAIQQPDEVQPTKPLTGLGAGQGLLVVPAGNTVTAFVISAPPIVPSTPIPTLSRWTLPLLALSLMVLAAGTFRRRR